MTYGVAVKHGEQRHEYSIYHQNSSCAAIRFQLNKDIGCINRDVMTKKTQEVQNRRRVLEQLRDIVIFIDR